MPINLKDFSPDNPEPGRLYTGLPVTPGGPPEPEQQVMLQPNIPDRLERLASIDRSRKAEHGPAGESEDGDE
jgi:hypothetical protein